MKKLLVLIATCFCLSGGVTSYAAEHVHADDCYETFRVPACDKNHGDKHKKSCYIVVKVLDCPHDQKSDDASDKAATKDKDSGTDRDKNSAGSDNKVGIKDKDSGTGSDKNSAGSDNKDKGSGTDRDENPSSSDSKAGTKNKGSDSKGSGNKAKRPTGSDKKTGAKDESTSSVKKSPAGFGDVKSPGSKMGKNMSVHKPAAGDDKTHIHTEDCYTIIRVLTCKSSEDEHKHTDDCYTTMRLFTCGMDTDKAQILSCGLDSHIHEDKCFTDVTWSCHEKSGTHIHDTGCFTYDENESNLAAQKNKTEADGESDTDLMKQWFWFFAFAVGGILILLVMSCVHEYRHNRKAG